MKQVDIDTWQAFRDFLEEAPTGGSAFYWRGQGNPDWPLASSLERKILSTKKGQMHAEDYAQLVRRHLDCFQLAACGMRGDSPKELSEEQWWALGRHYGLQTPLLDWTEKPYIALFFALRGGFVRDEEELATPADRFAMYRLCHNSELASDDLLVVKTPIDELGRMQQQRGLFTWIKAPNYYDLQRILDDTERGHLLTQGRISTALIPQALRDLKLHGIDHRLLFPDLYGAARHANSVLATDSCFLQIEGQQRRSEIRKQAGSGGPDQSADRSQARAAAHREARQRCRAPRTPRSSS